MVGGVGRFKLVASAVAGRLVDVAPAEPGTPAWTDGATIFVDGTACSSEQLRCVVVQACLLGAGSFHADVVAALARRPALVSRYLAIEGHRALEAQEDVLPMAARALVDPTIAERADSPAGSLGVATGRTPVPAAPAIFGTIRPRRLRALPAAATDRHDGEHAPRTNRRLALREHDDAEAAGSEATEGPAADLSSPVGGGGAVGRLLRRMLGDARSGGSASPGADTPTRYTRRSSRVSRNAAVTAASARLADDAGLVRGPGVTYPEWDVHRRCYRPEWCTVTEPDAEPEQAAAFAVPDTHALRRPLAQVGLDVERRHRQPQGDDLDVDAMVDAFVERAAGSAPDEAIYVDIVRRRRDLAVLVLLDISGSAGEPSVTGITVHEHQRAAAASLTVALDDLGDRVALYAFRSMGRTAVRVIPVKRFDDGVGPVVLRRLGALVPGAYTRLGAAIRHGAWVLEQGGGTGRRLLVVLSDGFAYDHGYEGAYGEADARRALAEARRRGTGCLCLSIGAVTDADALRRVFGTAAHATVPRPELLPGVVGPLFRGALRSAEVQRRSWQRVERTSERLRMEWRTA